MCNEKKRMIDRVDVLQRSGAMALKLYFKGVTMVFI